MMAQAAGGGAGFQKPRLSAQKPRFRSRFVVRQAALKSFWTTVPDSTPRTVTGASLSTCSVIVGLRKSPQITMHPRRIDPVRSLRYGLSDCAENLEPEECALVPTRPHRAHNTLLKSLSILFLAHSSLLVGHHHLNRQGAVSVFLSLLL